MCLGSFQADLIENEDISDPGVTAAARNDHLRVAHLCVTSPEHVKPDQSPLLAPALPSAVSLALAAVLRLRKQPWSSSPRSPIEILSAPGSDFPRKGN